MKYNFSAQFLKVLPPQTSFGDAWQALCVSLLQAEYGCEHCLPLNAPDRGVDIILRNENKAIQCKADERGAIGTIAPAKSVESFKTALSHKNTLEWETYAFATNANYSGIGVEKIFEVTDASAISRKNISFLGPEYWSALCEKYIDKVKYMLDYRLLYSEAEVEDAFRKARYYTEYVSKYSELIRKDSLRLEVSNNRTPITLSIPFSRELSIKECLEVSKALLGLNLTEEIYGDLGTSAQPSLSLTLDGVAQPFSRKISDFSDDELKRLKLWIRIIYKFNEDSEDISNSSKFMMFKVLRDKIPRAIATKNTLERFESSIQLKMWEQVTFYKSVVPTVDASNV